MSVKDPYTQIFKESYTNPFIFTARDRSKECSPICLKGTSESVGGEILPIRSRTLSQPMEQLVPTEENAKTLPSISLSERAQEAPRNMSNMSNMSTIKFMKILNIWKRLGIERYLELPQLVLAGPEKCGKSSIAESLTGFHVQYTTELQTRFPIEFTIYDDPNMVYSRAAIVLNTKCNDLSANGLSNVEKFNASHAKFLLATKGSFERLLDKVSEILSMTALNVDDELKKDTAQNSRSKVSSHMLCLEMRGPQGASFSFIDTPGVPPVDVSGGSETKSNQASKLVASLINQKRTIVAAAFEANFTKTPRGVFHWIKGVDPSLDRTIGIMTKCDQLDYCVRNINRSSLFPDMTENSMMPAHGLYGVRSKTIWEQTGFVSLEGVREREAALFRNCEWRSVSSDLPIRLGVHELLLGLDKKYADHVRVQYPLVHEEIKHFLSQRRTELEILRTRQRTIGEQRRYLMVVLRNLESTMQRCLSHERSIPMLDQLRSRLYEQINAQKSAFRDNLLTEGGKFQCQKSCLEEDPFLDESTKDFSVHDGKPDNIYTWINDKYQTKKASTLPGLIPDGLIQTLFEEQTAKWAAFSGVFINNIQKILLETVECIFRLICYDQTILPRLTSFIAEKTKKNIQPWRESCDALLRKQREQLQGLSSNPECIDQINTARTARFLNAMARVKEEQPVIKVPATSSFGPLLLPRRENDQSLTPPSSIGNASPKTPPVRWHNVFKNPALDTPPSTNPNEDLFLSLNPIAPTHNEWMFNIPDRTKRFQGQFENGVSTPDPPKQSQASGRYDFAQAQEIITHDREIVYQIHDILKAYYTTSLQSYTRDIFATLNESSIREILEGVSRRVDKDFSDEDLKEMSKESETDRRVRKRLEEDILKLELALLEGEVVLKDCVPVM